MAYCVNCGSEFGENQKYCGACGSAKGIITADVIRTRKSPLIGYMLIASLGLITVVGVGFLLNSKKLETIEQNVSLSTVNTTDPNGEPENLTGEISNSEASEDIAITSDASPEYDLSKNIEDKAFENAKASGRISTLGQFIRDYPQSTQKKETEELAYKSLERQNSEGAYKTFLKFFPNYDIEDFRVEKAISPDITLNTTQDGQSRLSVDEQLRALFKKSSDYSREFSHSSSQYLLSKDFEVHYKNGNTEYTNSILLDLLTRPSTSGAEKSLVYMRLITIDEDEQVENAKKALAYKNIPYDLRNAAQSRIQYWELLLNERQRIIDSGEELPRIDREKFKITVSDRRAIPLVRIPPIMPTRAEKSGHCVVKFDVSPEGSTYNISAKYCTENYFKRNAMKSIRMWEYSPAILNGEAIASVNLERKVSFRLTDNNGNIIPE